MFATRSIRLSKHCTSKHKWSLRTTAASGILVAAALTSSAWAASDLGYAPTPWGRGSAADKCVVCHSLEAGGPFRVAPNLYGIVGDDKARDRDWYGYSQALRTKGGTWTEEDLDQYLANAPKFAPGTTKSIRVSDPEQRKKIIEFLKTLRP